jgi:hypothetical protein
MSKTAQDWIDEYNESKIQHIIPICEFCSHGIEGNPITKVNVIKLNGVYYYQAYNGNKSVKYNSLEMAKLDIKSLYGKYAGFRFLV